MSWGRKPGPLLSACMLQRTETINSAGGYPRALTEKAKAREFSVGPMLMAALRSTGAHLQMVPK
jgi:replication initiation protein RepC